MGTRTIVTFHPDVECDVCGRRLLRGEHSDVFLTGGQRRQVCELCTARAAHEGWLRESDGHATSSRPSRPQRGLSLLGRLRQPRSDRPERPDRAGGTTRGSGAAARPSGSRGGHYDFLDPASPELEDSLDLEVPQPVLEPDSVAGVPPVGGERDWEEQAPPTTGELKVARAIEVFNASEQPRRIAGVTRSLGAPAIRVAPAADAGSVVAVVVAWELCWYRYEIDLGDEAAGVQLVGQGMELDELSTQDRQANAAADERGALSLQSG
jgi:hypothetical protein